MNQFRFPFPKILAIMDQFDLAWETDAWNRADREWKINLTRVVDAMTTWCHDSGIKEYGIGHTQIELCVTIPGKADAMMFKLRWYGA